MPNYYVQKLVLILPIQYYLTPYSADTSLDEYHTLEIFGGQEYW